MLWIKIFTLEEFVFCQWTQFSWISIKCIVRIIFQPCSRKMRDETRVAFLMLLLNVLIIFSTTIISIYFCQWPITFIYFDFIVIYFFLFISVKAQYQTIQKMYHESSIYIRRKYWIRKNFRLPVFDGFTCFEMSWTRFDHF